MRACRHLFPLVAALVIAGLVATPASSQGYPCGDDCVACEGSPGFVVGEVTGCQNCHADWATNICMPTTCATCHLESISDLPVVAEIVTLLEAAQPTDVATLVESYGDRLLIEVGRNLVIVKGGCDGNSMSGMAFVSEAVMAAFSRTAVVSLSAYLST